MRQYHILLKFNKVNCLLFLGILRLENLACLEKVCIYVCFIVCVMLRIYLQMCPSNRWRKREIWT